MKRHAMIVFSAFVTLATVLGQGKKDPAIKAWADSLTGQEKWLKIDVLRIEDSGNSKDATNIAPDGKLYYKAAIAGHHPATQTSTVDEFEEAARVTLRRDAEEDDDSDVGYTWKYKRGAKVRIHKIKLGKKDIKFEIKQGKKGKKTALRLKFDKKNYTLEEVKRSYSQAFAATESDLVETVTIEMGMTIDALIAAKGPPKSRINLGAKVILTYEDMKIVFQDGKLVDVQ